MLSAFMLSVGILTVFMLSVFILSVIILNVVAPQIELTWLQVPSDLSLPNSNFSLS